MHEYVAIGCSHTRCIYMKAKDRWVERIAETIGHPFYYRKTCKVAAGLINACHCTSELFQRNSKRVKWVVIQKPQALRFPWWIDNWSNEVSCSRYSRPKNIDLVTGRKISRSKIRRKNHKSRSRIAELIYQEELNCISILRDLFSNAQIAYYHYWGDYMMDSLTLPELAEVNVRIGEAVESMDIQNWKMIVNPQDIPGVYDTEGDVVMDNNILHAHKWICYPADLHPGLEFQNVVLNKVKDWIT